MKLPQTGGCQCGKIRYEITEEPRSVYTCHCLDCQRLTSSAFSLGVVVPETGFRLIGIEPRQLSRTADSGRVTVRLVCPECGSWVCGMPRGGKSGSGAELSMIRHGCGPPGIYGLAENKPGSCFRRATRFSRANPVDPLRAPMLRQSVGWAEQREAHRPACRTAWASLTLSLSYVTCGRFITASKRTGVGGP